MGAGRAKSAGIGSTVALLCGVLLAGCSDTAVESTYPYSTRTGRPSEYAKSAEDLVQNRKTIFGEGGINLFGGSDKDKAPGGGAGIGVNSYLWRASLDTISFMPINSADPFGGVIITDWHSPPQTPSERFKLNVYIIGRALRADGLRVAVFRQIQDNVGTWRDAAIPVQTASSIEDAILTKARQLRNETSQK